MASSSETKYFEVTVHHESIKSFSTALHLLQKIGKEITIEMESNIATLRALNDTKSAFAAVEFKDNFFDSFHLSRRLKTFSCKVLVKPVCVIFRSLKGMKQLKIRAGMADSSEHELVFEIILMNDITRTYRFRYQDCEVMSAVFDEDNCSYIRAKPSLFIQLFNHIYQSPEISMEIEKEKFSVRSFHKSNEQLAADGSAVPKYMHSGLSVNIQEFEQYEYLSALQSEELIFCMKEVSAFLGYAEVLDVPDFELFFSGSGRAIKYAARQDSYAATLVLATIESAQHRMLHASQQQMEQGQLDQTEREAQFTQDISFLEDDERRQDQPSEGEEADLSQPVTCLRRRAVRSEQGQSAFLRYMGDGEEDFSAATGPDVADELCNRAGLEGGESSRDTSVQDQEVGDIMDIAVVAVGSRPHNSSKDSSNSMPAARRKRFLDEDSDEE